MKVNTIYKFTLSLLFLFVATACEKDFLDVNTDPNNASRATVNLVLPAAIGYSAYQIGNPYQILGGFWSQYWTQNPNANQYPTIDEYRITSSSYDRAWQSFYSGPLNDLKFITDEGIKTKDDTKLTQAARDKGSNYAAIGKILTAYDFQVLTDLHGDIPFTEALDPNNLDPKYDAQEVVYDGLIALLDEAVALIVVDPSHVAYPGADDLIYGGDMEHWLKFANTLKLKVYLRQSKVRPAVAEAGIKAMYATGAEFIGFGDNAEMKFVDNTLNKNPLYSTTDFLGDVNIIGSNTIINFLKNTNDPRGAIFFRNATTGINTGTLGGLDQGDGRNISNALNTDYSFIGEAVAGPTAPVTFISESESFFLQAEVVVRGWGNGDAKALYENGILASFTRWELEDEIDDYIAQAEVDYDLATDKIEAIITQKWVSMTGTQNLESWSEWRRTGYPDFFIVSKTSGIGNSLPARILYPSSEETSNPNLPAQKTVSDRVWWDVD